MALAMPAGYAASTPTVNNAPSGLQMPGGLQMPALPNTGTTSPAMPSVTSGLTTIPAKSSPLPSTSGLNTGAGIAPATSVPSGLSLGTTQSTATPTSFQTQPIPSVTLHPNIVTPSGATVNPSTGGLVAPPPNSGINTGNGVQPASSLPAGVNLGGTAPPVPSVTSGTATQTPTFYKPGPNDPGYDSSNPQAVYDSTGKALDYTAYINAGGKSDFSNVTPGAVPASNPPATTPPVTPPLTPYQSAVAKLQADTAATPENSPAQTELNQLETQLGINQAGAESQRIPGGFITGEEKVMQDSELAQAAPLTQQIAQLQAQRTATLAADQAAVDATKPVSTPIGTSLTSPTTGQQLGGLAGTTTTGTNQSLTGQSSTDATGGASDEAILGYLQTAGISVTRYSIPGLISAVRQGSTAQDIINGKVSVAAQTAGATAAASNKSQFMLDGNGNLIQVTPSVAGANASTTQPPVPTGTGAFSAKTPASSTSSNTKFTLGTDGKTVLANGTPIDLPTFQQMTGQTGKSLAQTDFSMVQKPASASSNSNSSSAASLNTGLSPSANQYFLSGDIKSTGAGSETEINKINGQVQNYAASLGITDWSASKVEALNAGDAANYAQTVQKLTDTTTALQNADQAFTAIQKMFPGMNTSSSPLYNMTANYAASTLTGGQRIAFQGAMTELGNEYAQVFSRGGVTTVNSHVSAAGVIDPDISMKDLASLAESLQANGKIVTQGWANDVNSIIAGYGPKSSSSPASTAPVKNSDGTVSISTGTYKENADGSYTRVK